MSCWVQFLSKLTIFIWKQLKRHVAFSAVQTPWQSQCSESASCLIKASPFGYLLTNLQNARTIVGSLNVTTGNKPTLQKFLKKSSCQNGTTHPNSEFYLQFSFDFFPFSLHWDMCLSDVCLKCTHVHPIIKQKSNRSWEFNLSFCFHFLKNVLFIFSTFWFVLTLFCWHWAPLPCPISHPQQVWQGWPIIMIWSIGSSPWDAHAIFFKLWDTCKLSLCVTTHTDSLLSGWRAVPANAIHHKQKWSWSFQNLLKFCSVTGQVHENGLDVQISTSWLQCHLTDLAMLLWCQMS